MASRLLARYGRLLRQSSVSVPPAHLHAPLPELMSSSWRPYVSARLISKSPFNISNKPNVSNHLAPLLEKKNGVAVTEEDVLKKIMDWSERKGNADEGANIIIDMAKLMSSNDNSSLMEDPHLNDLMTFVWTQAETVSNYNLMHLLAKLMVLKLPKKTYLVKRVQGVVLKRIRTFKYNQLTFLFIIHNKEENLAFVQQVMEQLERRWLEISDAKSIIRLTPRVNEFSPKMAKQLEDKVFQLAEGFSTEDIQSLLVALAEANQRSIPLLGALSHMLFLKPTPEFDCQTIMNVFYAYAKLYYHHTPVLQRLVPLLTPHVPVLGIPKVANCSKSLALLSYLDVPLFEAFSEHFIKNSKKYSSVQICNLIMAFAKFGFEHSRAEVFYEKVHGVLGKTLSELNPRLQTCLVWSLCVLQQTRPHYLVPLTETKHISALLDGGQTLALKLLNIAATLHLEHPEASGPPPFLMALRVPTPKTQLSPFRTNLLETLQSLSGGKTNTLRTGVETVYGWTIDGEMLVNAENKPLNLTKFEAPHLPPGGGNQSLPEGARRIAFVALEFKNFILNSKEQMGSLALMKRHLQLAGFLIVEVPYYEWLEIKDPTVKVSYLKQKLKKVIAEDMAS